MGGRGFKETVSRPLSRAVGVMGTPTWVGGAEGEWVGGGDLGMHEVAGQGEDGEESTPAHRLTCTRASVPGVAPGTGQQAKNTRHRNTVPSSVVDVRFEVPRDIRVEAFQSTVSELVREVGQRQESLRHLCSSVS